MRKQYRASDPTLDSIEHSLCYLTRKLFVPRDLRQSLRTVNQDGLRRFAVALNASVQDKLLEKKIAEMHEHSKYDGRIELCDDYRIVIMREGTDAYKVSVVIDGAGILSNALKRGYDGKLSPSRPNDF